MRLRLNHINLIALTVLLLLSVLTQAQSRKDLEKKKKKNQQEIKTTNELLKQTQRDKKISMNQLVILNKKIDARKELIETIGSEVEDLNQKIEDSRMIIEAMESDLKKMKETYARMIRYAYKNRNSYNKLLFLLSAEDFNQAYMRLRYMQLYSDYREKQILAIKATQDILNEKLAELEEKKAQKEGLLNEEKSETEQLTVEKNEKNKLVTDLKSKEQELKKKLEKQKLADKQLQKEINDVIAAEIKKAEEERKKEALKNPDKNKTNIDNKKPNVFNLTPEEQLVSDNFATNQGKLPWPTERGVITGTYGEHEHPVLKGIKVKNDGVYISTTKGSKARAIFDGTVSKRISVPGKNKAVIVRHGNYLTVYSNLTDVTVKAGDKIKAKAPIGTIYTDEDDDGKTVLELQVWNGTVKQNPELWITSMH
jgi:septal ring factor EnvC (AmiA/AmiB activator)